MMKLSIVIPVFCLEKFVVDCVDSVLRQQTNFEFEVLVRDDASTDNTAEILLAYKRSLPEALSKRLKLFIAKENKGLVGNLKELFTHCTGEYIAYLDGDDFALPEKLQVLVDYLDANPSCALAYHEAEVFDSESGAILGNYSRDFYNAAYIPQKADISHLVKYGTFLQASAVMYRNHGRLESVLDPEIKIIVDYPMHMFNAFFGKGTIDRIDKVLGRYRVHPDSFGAQTSRSAERREAVLGDLIKACDNAKAMGVSEDDINAGKAHFQYAAALYFLRMGELAFFDKHITHSAERGCYFDSRHRFAFEHRHQPQRIMEKLSLIKS
jgi:glycosyltransferase involved in cell wall biosynthesis